MLKNFFLLAVFATIASCSSIGGFLIPIPTNICFEGDKEKGVCFPSGITKSDEYFFVSNRYNLFIVDRATNRKIKVIKIPSGHFFDRLTKSQNKLYSINRWGAFAQLMRIDPLTGEVSSFAGTKRKKTRNGFGIKAGFHTPIDIISTGDFLYITDKNRIRKIDPKSGYVSTYSGKTRAGYINGDTQYAEFDNLHAIATDGDALYVSDCGNQAIRKIDLIHHFVETLITNEKNPSISCSPGMVVHKGYLYIMRGRYIDRLDLKSLVLEEFLKSDFRRVQALTSDGQYLYVADYGNHAVKRVDPQTNEVKTLVFHE